MSEPVENRASDAWEGVALAAGVHRSSIHNWFKRDPNIKQAVEETRRDRNARLTDQTREFESLARVRHNSTDLDTSRGFRSGGSA